MFTLNFHIPFTDPQDWSRDQVHAWLQYTMKQFKISITQDIETVFDEDGRQLSRLNEIDFVTRIPQVNSMPFFIGWGILFIVWEIWAFGLKKKQQQQNSYENHIKPSGGRNIIRPIGNLESISMLWLRNTLWNATHLKPFKRYVAMECIVGL